jgi:hypothetical protein
MARLVAGRPEPVEHDAVRWLAATELEGLDWLEPDRPFLPEIAAMLGPESDQERDRGHDRGPGSAPA